MLPYFSDAQRQELVQFDLKWLLGYGWGKAEWSSQAIEDLLPYISPEQVQQLAHDSEEMFRDSSRPWVMALILPYLPKTQQRSWAEKVYQLALELPEPFYGGAPSIAKVMPYLDPIQQREALNEGIKIALKTPREENRVRDLQALIPCIPEEKKRAHIRKIFNMSLALDWGWGRGGTLVPLYPYLNNQQREQAFAVLTELPERQGFSPFSWLVSIIRHLSTE